MDKAQMCPGTGIRYGRVHAAAGRAKVFWCDSGWLLRKQKTRLRRQSRHWLHCEIIVDAAQEIPKGSTRRLPVCRFTIKAQWAMGAGHHTLDDAENAVGKSGFRL